MKHIRQPKNSNICGQCCISTISSIELSRILNDLGHGRTSSTTITTYLKAKKAKRQRKKPATLCLIATQEIGNRNWHWAVLDKNTVFDPALKTIVKFSLYEKKAREEQKTISFLPLIL